MKPVSLPMLHLFSRDKRCQRRAGNIGLAAAVYSEHAFMFMREDFNKSRQRFGPVVENPGGARTCGELQMTGYQNLHEIRFCEPGFEVGFYEACVLRFENRLEVD